MLQMVLARTATQAAKLVMALLRINVWPAKIIAFPSMVNVSVQMASLIAAGMPPTSNVPLATQAAKLATDLLP